MAIHFIKKIAICNSKLEDLFKEKIGNGEKDIFIEITDHLKELDYDNTFKLGEYEIEGVKVLRKLGAIYLNNNEKVLKNKMDKMVKIIPSLKYTNKQGDTISTLEYIANYNQYSLKLEVNDNEKELLICTYTEAL